MTETPPRLPEPTEKQLALFRIVEDIQDATAATVVLLVDVEGEVVAASGDVDEVPGPYRVVLSGKRLAAAGSVRALLESVGEFDTRLNITLFDAGSGYVLAILFGAEADLFAVRDVGEDARELLQELLAAT